MRQAFHPNPIPPYPSHPYPKVTANMDATQYPSIVRQYIALSPDSEAMQESLYDFQAHAGLSIAAFGQWLHDRLEIDAARVAGLSWQLPSEEFATTDLSWLDEFDNPSNYLNELQTLV